MQKKMLYDREKIFQEYNFFGSGLLVSISYFIDMIIEIRLLIVRVK